MGLGPTLDFETTSIVHSIAKRKLDDVGIIGVIAQLWSSDTGQSANTNEWCCPVSPRRGGGGGGIAGVHWPADPYLWEWSVIQASPRQVC